MDAHNAGQNLGTRAGGENDRAQCSPIASRPLPEPLAGPGLYTALHLLHGKFRGPQQGRWWTGTDSFCESPANFGATESRSTNSDTANRFSYGISAKMTLLGTLRRQKRDYSDAIVPTIAPGGQIRSDTLDTAGLVLVYTPLDRVVVNVTAQREERKSNVDVLSYTVNTLAATVQWAF